MISSTVAFENSFSSITYVPRHLHPSRRVDISPCLFGERSVKQLMLFECVHNGRYTCSTFRMPSLKTRCSCLARNYVSSTMSCRAAGTVAKTMLAIDGSCTARTTENCLFFVSRSNPQLLFAISDLLLFGNIRLNCCCRFGIDGTIRAMMPPRRDAVVFANEATSIVGSEAWPPYSATNRLAQCLG